MSAASLSLAKSAPALAKSAPALAESAPAPTSKKNNAAVTKNNAKGKAKARRASQAPGKKPTSEPALPHSTKASPDVAPASGRTTVSKTRKRLEKKTPLAADLMTSPAICCRSTDRLNAAAQLMWEHDLGAIVVVNEQHEPISLVTDRDLCMATYTQGVPLFLSDVATAMSTSIVSCTQEAPLEEVRARMLAHQLRRIPITDLQGKLVGIIGIADLAREAASTLPKTRKRGTSNADLLHLVAGIHAPGKKPTQNASSLA